MSEEEAFIRSFVVPEKRERYAGFVGNPKRRRKFTSTLPHFPDRDTRFVVPIPSDRQSAEWVERELRARGAGDSCLVLSEESEFDGQRLSLGAALDLVMDKMWTGSILSCVPGRPAYYEGEGPSDRCILAREHHGGST